MSAVDAPPGIAFAGRASGEFVARGASLRLARRGFAFVAVVSGVAFALALRGGFRGMANGKETRLVGPLVALSIAAVCLAVRRARLRIDGAGVRWGWDTAGFRVTKDTLAGATVYHDAIAFRRPGGSPWYLGRSDFDDFDRIPAVLRRAGIPFDVAPRRAPWRARLQTYGVALDVLIVLDTLFASAILAAVLGG